MKIWRYIAEKTLTFRAAFGSSYLLGFIGAFFISKGDVGSLVKLAGILIPFSLALATLLEVVAIRKGWTTQWAEDEALDQKLAAEKHLRSYLEIQRALLTILKADYSLGSKDERSTQIHESYKWIVQYIVPHIIEELRREKRFLTLEGWERVISHYYMLLETELAEREKRRKRWLLLARGIYTVYDWVRSKPYQERDARDIANDLLLKTSAISALAKLDFEKAQQPSDEELEGLLGEGGEQDPLQIFSTAQRKKEPA